MNPQRSGLTLYKTRSADYIKEIHVPSESTADFNISVQHQAVRKITPYHHMVNKLPHVQNTSENSSSICNYCRYSAGGPVPCTHISMPACLQEKLKENPDKMFIMEGRKNGFYIVDSNAMPKPSEMENYPSTNTFHAAVEK